MDPLRVESGLLHSLPSGLAQQLCVATTTANHTDMESGTALLAAEPLVPSAAIGDAPLPADASHTAAEPTPAHNIAAVLQVEPSEQQLKKAVARLLALGPGDGLGQRLMEEGPMLGGSPPLLDRLLDAPGSIAPLYGPSSAVRPRPQRPASAPSTRLASPARLGSWSPQAAARREAHSAAGTGDGAKMAFGQDGDNVGVRLYARQLTWKEHNQQRYDEMRWEEGRRELQDCTFSPRICSRSRQLSGRAAEAEGGAQPQADITNAGMRIYKRQLIQRLQAKQRAEDARREREEVAMAECTFSPKIDRRSRHMLSAGAQRCYPPPRDFTAGMASAAAHAGAELSRTAATAGVGAGNLHSDDGWIEIAPGSSIEEIAALCMQGVAPVSALAAACPEQTGPGGDETGAEFVPGAGQSEGSSDGSHASGWERQSELFPGSGACAAPLLQPSPIKTRQSRPPSAEVQLAACRRLHAHAVDMQRRQAAAKAALAQQELEAAQRASPRIKALPSFYRHTASSAARMHRGSGGGCTSDGPDAAVAAAQPQRPAGTEEDAALFHPQTAHDAGFWARHKLNAAPDFGAFLERQQRHLEQSRAKLERRRAAPPPPPPAPSPGTVRLLAAMEQRAAAAQEAEVAVGDAEGGSLPRRPGSAAAAFAHGIASMLRPSSAAAAPSSPASPGPLRSPGRPASRGSSRARGAEEAAEAFTHSPKISARAEAKPARSPGQLHADWEAQRRRQQAAAAAAEAARLAACTFRPASATAGPGPSQRYAGVPPRVPTRDPGAWSRRLVAREAAAAAAAEAREARELAECTFKPALHQRRPPSAGPPPAQRATGIKPATAAPQDGAVEEEQQQQRPMAGGAADATVRAGCYPAPGATSAPSSAAGWSCFLDLVSMELGAMQTAASAACGRH